MSRVKRGVTAKLVTRKLLNLQKVIEAHEAELSKWLSKPLPEPVNMHIGTEELRREIFALFGL